MAPKQKHQRRLLVEMSRDLNRTIDSLASSTGSQHGTVSTDSTMSDFDPENEAIMSTRNLDTDNLSQRLPELRDTAKKYGQWTGRREPEFMINTSAIGRAFPDFSQGGDSDDSMNIEIGRGAKPRERIPNKLPRLEFSDNINSPPVRVGDFKVMTTPVRKAPRAVNQDSIRRSGKDNKGKNDYTPLKEIQQPRASPARIASYVSGASRNTSGDQGRRFANLQAHVADDTETSFLDDESRPATVTFAGKNSRFPGTQPNAPAQQPEAAKKRQQQQQRANEMLREAFANNRNATPSKPQAESANNLVPTQQSFLLPTNMPELSELVSGTFRNGTPVFTQSGQVQRVPSGSSGKTLVDKHHQIDSIPVPEDEKAIFLSLQILQDRVAQLESEKADEQRRNAEVQQRVYQLEAEKKELERRRRADSALGLDDSSSDGDYGRGKKSSVEKTKLEAQIKALQSRLDSTERKFASQELRLTTNTAERDQAVRQLAEAFQSNEGLLTENDELRREIALLKRQIAQLEAAEDELRREGAIMKRHIAEYEAANNDNTRMWEEKEALLRRKISRRDDAVKAARQSQIDLTQEIEDLKNETTEYIQSCERSRSRSHARKPSEKTAMDDLQARITEEVQNQIRGTQSSKSTPSRRGRNSAAEKRPEPATRTRSRSQSRQRVTYEDDTTRNSRTSNFIDDSMGSFGSDSAIEGSTELCYAKTRNNRARNAAPSHTDEIQAYLSSVEAEAARVRQHIEDQQKAKKLLEVLRAPSGSQERDDTIYSTRSHKSDHSRSENTVLRKGSNKAPAGILKKSTVADAKDDTVRSTASERRRHSETSALSTRSNRRRLDEDMTSAFILPDITVNVKNTAEGPALSSSARKVLDNLAQHDGHNCTVCTRIASFDTASGKVECKHTVNIEKPIPVSERMPVAVPYEDEPTMRPSVAPGLALATVMKGLQDELAHMKIELAQYQSLYNQHDPSLSKRKRKHVHEKITGLLKNIDTKSDQIYALYDVLEGQKQSGQELSEKEVEITLMSIGVDVRVEKGNNNNDEETSSEGSEESELDLPWEGIEDTKSDRRGSW